MIPLGRGFPLFFSYNYNFETLHWISQIPRSCWCHTGFQMFLFKFQNTSVTTLQVTLLLPIENCSWAQLESLNPSNFQFHGKCQFLFRVNCYIYYSILIINKLKIMLLISLASYILIFYISLKKCWMFILTPLFPKVLLFLLYNFVYCCDF